MAKVFFKVSKQKEKGVPVKNKISWYDPFYKTLLTFDGVGLKFVIKKETYVNTEDGPVSLEDAVKKVKKYNEENKSWISLFRAKKIVEENCEILTKYRLYPEPILSKTSSKKNIDINKWFDTYQNYTESSVEIDEDFEDNIIFECAEKDTQDFFDLLEENRLEFEVL
jgi:hypothetical protein